VEGLFLYLVVLVILFLVFRVFVLWYWRVNESVRLLKEISEKLDRLPVVVKE
jgi:hypothetical protein